MPGSPEILHMTEHDCCFWQQGNCLLTFLSFWLIWPFFKCTYAFSLSISAGVPLCNKVRRQLMSTVAMKTCFCLLQCMIRPLPSSRNSSKTAITICSYTCAFVCIFYEAPLLTMNLCSSHIWASIAWSLQVWHLLERSNEIPGHISYTEHHIAHPYFSFRN